LYDKMAGLARNLGNKTSAAGIVFPAWIVQWIDRVKLREIMHMLPSQKYNLLNREGTCIGTWQPSFSST
jgi:hypothetical protein